MKQNNSDTLLSGTSPYLAVRKSTPHYLPLPNPFPSLNTLTLRSDIRSEQLIPALYVAIQVLFLYSMRSIELLRLTTADLIGSDRAFVKSAKHSADYCIFLPHVDFIFGKQVRAKQVVRLFFFSYNQLYRSCIRAGISNDIRYHTNKVRSHMSRYLIADSVAARYGRQSAADTLHHKGKSSIGRYINKQEGR